MEGRRNSSDKMKVEIYINSSHREKIKTIVGFPERWKPFTHIVVPAAQYRNYQHISQGWDIIKIPQNIPNYLSSQRQWCVEISQADYVFFMDDDLGFFRKKESALVRCTEKDMEEMLDAVCENLLTFPLVGISSKINHFVHTGPYKDITRISRCYCFSRDVFRELKINLAPFEPFLMQDVHLALSFVKNGYPNRMLTNWCQCDTPNSAGGCSRYRTAPLIHKVCSFLEQEHYGFIRVFQRETKGKWKSLKGGKRNEEGCMVRENVEVEWKKAYLYGKGKRNRIKNFGGLV